MGPDHCSLTMWNITYLGSAVTVHCPETMSNLSNFRCRPRSRVGKMLKCQISINFGISDKTSTFVCRDMKYHTHSRSGHGTVIINMGQTLKCAVSNWAPLAHFNKRSEDIPTWHSGHNRTNIAEYGPMRIMFGFTVAQLYREVAISNQNCVVIGPKSARSSPLPVSRAHSKLERFLIVFEHCAVAAALAHAI